MSCLIYEYNLLPDGSCIIDLHDLHDLQQGQVLWVGSVLLDMIYTVPAQHLVWADIQDLDGLSVDDLSVDDLSVDDLSVDDISVDDPSVDGLPVDDLSVDDLSVEYLSVEYLSVDYLSVEYQSDVSKDCVAALVSSLIRCFSLGLAVIFVSFRCVNF